MLLGLQSEHCNQQNNMLTTQQHEHEDIWKKNKLFGMSSCQIVHSTNIKDCVVKSVCFYVTRVSWALPLTFPWAFLNL